MLSPVYLQRMETAGVTTEVELAHAQPQTSQHPVQVDGWNPTDGGGWQVPTDGPTFEAIFGRAPLNSRIKTEGNTDDELKRLASSIMLVMSLDQQINTPSTSSCLLS